ncbi:MAG: cation transporter [Candidatus Eremiobacteraeota bacterium]|nr:cation transporter [Candidatus Eremiobacteraeota bacterium]
MSADKAATGHHAHASHGAPLAVALCLTFLVAALELVGGFVAHSLALLSDSAHVFMDVLALAISVFAAWQAQRPANDRRSYGYARFEILAALANGVLLFGVTVAIAIEAVHRFGAVASPAGAPMAIFAGIGLAVNVGIGISLARSAHGDMNVRAALFHVAGDAIGALAVAAGGIAVLATHASWIDPAVSLGVAALIVAGVVRIVRESADVLLQSAPAHAAIPVVRQRMLGIAGVVGIHDLHVWTLGSNDHVLSAHVLLEDKRISEASAVLRALESTLRDEFDIDHVTLQFECTSCSADDAVVVAEIGTGRPPGT